MWFVPLLIYPSLPQERTYLWSKFSSTNRLWLLNIVLLILLNQVPKRFGLIDLFLYDWTFWFELVPVYLSNWCQPPYNLYLLLCHLIVTTFFVVLNTKSLQIRTETRGCIIFLFLANWLCTVGYLSKLIASLAITEPP